MDRKGHLQLLMVLAAVSVALASDDRLSIHRTHCFQRSTELERCLDPKAPEKQTGRIYRQRWNDVKEYLEDPCHSFSQLMHPRCYDLLD